MNNVDATCDAPAVQGSSTGDRKSTCNVPYEYNKQIARSELLAYIIIIAGDTCHKKLIDVHFPFLFIFCKHVFVYDVRFA